MSGDLRGWGAGAGRRRETRWRRLYWLGNRLLSERWGGSLEMVELDEGGIDRGFNVVPVGFENDGVASTRRGLGERDTPRLRALTMRLLLSRIALDRA